MCIKILLETLCHCNVIVTVVSFKPCKFSVALIGVVLVTINTLILSLDILQSKVVIYNENACDLVNCWLRLLILVGKILFLAVSNVDTQQWCQSLYKVLHWLITTLIDILRSSQRSPFQREGGPLLEGFLLSSPKYVLLLSDVKTEHLQNLGVKPYLIVFISTVLFY